MRAGSGNLIGANDCLIVTDTFRWLARLVGQGYRNVLLMRGSADAEMNARRIAAAGVRSVMVRCRRDGDAIALALSTAGIAVSVESGAITGDDWLTAATTPLSSMQTVAEPLPAPVPEVKTPVLVAIVTPALRVVEPLPAEAAAPATIEVASHVQTEASVTRPAPIESLIGMTVQLVDFSEDRNLALFEVGPLRYAFEVAEHDLPTRQVVARCGQSAHQDRINLDVPAQCRRFATSASRRLNVDHQRIEKHLADAWRQVREREARADEPPVVAVGSEERITAEVMLRDPAMLSHIERDLGSMGWVGEDRTKPLLYLTAVSRLLPDPLWSVFRATAGAAPWKSLGIIAALMPPEECVVFHRLTESVLRRTDQRALKHRLLLVDRAETLRPEGAIALRCLRECGSIGWQQVAQAESAGSPGILGEVKGPVAVLAAAAGDLDLRCRGLLPDRDGRRESRADCAHPGRATASA